MNERARADGETEQHRAAQRMIAPIAHPEEARDDDGERGQSFGHDERRICDEPGMKGA